MWGKVIMKYRKIFNLIERVFILFVVPVILVFGLVWSENSIYYAVAVVILLGLFLALLKYIVVRCPKCRKRPIHTGNKRDPFPERCQYCGEKFEK